MCRVAGITNLGNNNHFLAQNSPRVSHDTWNPNLSSQPTKSHLIWPLPPDLSPLPFLEMLPFLRTTQECCKVLGSFRKPQAGSLALSTPCIGSLSHPLYICFRCNTEGSGSVTSILTPVWPSHCFLLLHSFTWHLVLLKVNLKENSKSYNLSGYNEPGTVLCVLVYMF